MNGTIRKREHKRESDDKVIINYEFACRIDTSDVDQRQLKRAGYKMRKDAQAGLKRVHALVDLAGSDDRLRRKIGDLIFAARYGRPLPSVDEVRRRLGAGREPDACEYTLGEWLDTWLAGRGDLEASTRGSYRIHIEKHLKPHIGDVQLDRLDSRHIKAMFDAINARITGLNTQRQILKTLRAALYAAMDQEHLIVRNPAARFKLARAPETKRVWWSAEEVRRFLEATSGDRLAALWRTALMGGLRLGELLALRWADVDLDAKTLHVRYGKTPSSRRTVSLDAGTVKVLREHQLRQKKERLATFGAYHDDDLVFAREDGTPIQVHRPRIEFKRRARQLGLPVIRFHDARHSNASMLLEAGVDIKVVSERLGHSSTRITHDVYQHVAPRLQADASDRLSALVDG